MSNLDARHQDQLIQWLSGHTGIMQQGAEAFLSAMANLSDPHVSMRPRVYQDGNQWCALYGEDLQLGVVGFGDSPAAACAEFNKAWYSKLKSKSQVAELISISLRINGLEEDNAVLVERIQELESGTEIKRLKDLCAKLVGPKKVSDGT